MKSLHFVLIALLVATPLVASAKTVVRGGETISINDEQIIEHDFYAWGNRVSMSGEVLGDMNALAGQVAINGSVQSDVSVMSGSAQVYGDVEDDVRLLAGEAVVAGVVKGDVFAVAGSLTVLSTATIEGDVIFFGGEATIEGTVGGDIQGAMGMVRIDSEVGGINLSSDSVTLGDGAVVKGDVQYKSNNELVRSTNAVVEGSVVKNTPSIVGDEGSFRSYMLAFVVLAACGLVLLFALRKRIIRAVSHPGKSNFDVLFGFLFFFFAPLAGVMLLVTGLFLPLGFLVLTAYIGAVVFAVLFSTIYVGTWAMKLAKMPTTFKGIETIFGALLLVALAALPYIGGLLALLAVLYTLGFLLRKTVRLLQ